MRDEKQKIHVKSTQEFNHSIQLFEELTDSEIEKVCGGATELEFEEYEVDFKFAKVEYTAEFLTLKL
jgi:hypothetical protein